MSELKKRLLFMAAQLAVFAALYLVSQYCLHNMYVFEWTARSMYLCIWIPVVILSFYGKHAYALALTIGNVSGVFVGQELGTALMLARMKQLEANPTAVEQNWYVEHKGAFIWGGVILAALAGTFIVRLCIKLTRRRRKASRDGA